MPNEREAPQIENPHVGAEPAAIDPVHVVVLALCALALLAISWHYLAA
jgi:hypothetical protein